MRRLEVRWPRYSLRELAIVAIVLAGVCGVIGASDDLAFDEKVICSAAAIVILPWMFYAWKFVRLNMKKHSGDAE